MTRISLDRMDLSAAPRSAILKRQSSPGPIRQTRLPIESLRRISQALHKEIVLTGLQKESKNHWQHILVGIRSRLMCSLPLSCLNHFLYQFFLAVGEPIVGSAILVEFNR